MTVTIPLWLFIGMLIALPSLGFILCGLLWVSDITEAKTCDPDKMGECKDIARYYYHLGRKRKMEVSREKEG